MNNSDDLPENTNTGATSIPRTLSTTDFSKLRARQSSECRARSPQSSALTARSEDYSSENSQILYMKASKRSKRTDRPLSSISNGSSHVMDGSSDTKSPLDCNAALDELSWNVIDREIFEWRYVCQTGRPFWWSPESKYTRFKKLQPGLFNEPNPRIWMRDIIDEHSKPAYDRQRRAVSESYLSDSTTAHDLAHLIAVQLLGSCFTLPPDRVTGAPSPNYTKFGKCGATVPDPRMISSLRMHTRFRYSPCFGHQARNTSPVQVWPGTYDGHSPGSTPPPTDTGLQTPYTGTSGFSYGRRRAHGVLHGMGDSSYERSLDSDTDGYTNSAIDSIEPATTWDRRRVVSDDNYRVNTTDQLTYDGNRSRPLGSRHPRYRPPVTPPPSSADADPTTTETYRGVQSSQLPKSNYRLHPVIHSEPHHVFVQPVKELVVKRWKTCRRRFGGSLHTPLPSEDKSPMSDSGANGHSSPAMSGGRERRRRAQERGEIHSSSVDSTAHYNSPASGHLSPDRGIPETPYWMDSSNATTKFQFADPPPAAAALVAAEVRSNSNQSQPFATQSSNISSPSVSTNLPESHTGCSSNTSIAIGGNVPQNTETAFLSPLKQPSPSSAHSFSSRRTQARRRRKSMLSEVCTPEDLRYNIAESEREAVERSILSTVGGTLVSPREEAELVSPLRLTCQWIETVGSPSPEASVGKILMPERPRMSRTSTSGSQIFTPSEDGVELDGLPVGPSKDMWAEKGQRGDRTYL